MCTVKDDSTFWKECCEIANESQFCTNKNLAGIALVAVTSRRTCCILVGAPLVVAVTSRLVGAPIVVTITRRGFPLGTFRTIVLAKDLWIWCLVTIRRKCGILVGAPLGNVANDMRCLGGIALLAAVTSRYKGRMIRLRVFIWRCLEWCWCSKIYMCEVRELLVMQCNSTIRFTSTCTFTSTCFLLLLGWSEVVLDVSFVCRLS